MSVFSRKSKLSALLLASLISVNFVCASDTYKNNVVDVRVNKESGDSVKVTIYTDRPYTEPVVVNKKANNKYVILMPETKSTLKSAPAVTNGSGTISNVSVNTQSVAGGKGYTKIIITSEKAITVVPRTQQLVSSTHKNVQKPIAKTTSSVQSKPVVKQHQVQNKKPVVAADKQTVTKKTTQAVAQKSTSQTQQQSKQTQKPAQKPTQKLVQTPVKNPVQTPVQKQPEQIKKEPIQVLEQEVKTGQYANIPPEKSDELSNNELKTNTISETKQDTAINTNVHQTSVINNIKSVLKGYKNISLWKLLLLAGAITFPIIVIMIILNLDKKINKKIDTTFKREEENTPNYLQQESVVQNVDDTMSTSEQHKYNSFDEMLSHVDEPETTYHERQLARSEFEEFSQSMKLNSAENIDYISQESVEGFNNDFVSDDFDTEPVSKTEIGMSKNNSEVSAKIEQNENNIIQSEVVEEIPEPKENAAIAKEVQLPAEPYNPDGYIADFAEAQISEINDSDFFDELVIQTMADNNKNGLPQESPADNVFNYIDESKVSDENKADIKPISGDVQDYNQLQEFISKPQEKSTIEEPDVQTYVSGDDELTMLTEVKLNDTTGMYLVNYDNFSSLVGHINDDYFVLKKFDEIVTGRIFLKETENLKDSKRYLVRVGKSKMVVEVSDTTMNRLLDL